MNVKRNDTLDILSGILIIWMIVYHSFQWANMTESNLFVVLIRIFYFFMPWFYFKSGFVLNNKRPLKKVIEKGVTHILTPLIIWGLIGYLIFVFSTFVIEEAVWKTVIKPFYYLLKTGDMIGNEPLWFLLSLFLIRIILNLIINLRIEFILLFIIGFAFIGWIMQLMGIESLPIGLNSLPLGIVFTSLGLLCNRLNVFRTITKFKYLLLLLSIIMSIYFSSYIDIHFNSIWYGNYWSYIINSTLIIFVCVLFLVGIKSKILTWIGEKSIFYLVMHWPIFYLTNYFFILNNIPQNNYFYMLILNTSALFIITLVAKFLPEKYLGLEGTRFLFKYKQVFQRTSKT